MSAEPTDISKTKVTSHINTCTFIYIVAIVLNNCIQFVKHSRAADTLPYELYNVCFATVTYYIQ